MIKKMNYCLGLEETNGLSLGFQTVLCSQRDNYQRTPSELSSLVAAEAAGLNYFCLESGQASEGQQLPKPSGKFPEG